MEYRDYDLNSYKLHVIKSNKAKTCHMEVHFRDKVDKKNIHYKSFLSDILTDCSKNYETRKSVVIRLEELYKSSFYGTVSKTGGVINTMFIYDFIAPEFIKENNYLEEVLKMPFDMILNPKVINKEFELKTFNVVKERMRRDIESINETPTKLSIQKTLTHMDEESESSVSVLGNLDTLEDITPITLYKEYNKMINENHCDIFIIGNVDFDEVYKIVSKNFKLKTIKTNKLNIDVDNKESKKVKEISEDSKFVQSSLNLVYNIKTATKEEKNITMQVYNYLLGSGGLNSKLYKKLREENSLCYGVYSMYLKYDNLLLIQVSLDESNRVFATNLIKECIKEMENVDFKDEDLEDAKNNLLLSLLMTFDNNTATLSNYIFRKYYDLPTIEERMEKIRKITKEDIKKIGKKIKINTIYTLKGGKI